MSWYRKLDSCLFAVFFFLADNHRSRKRNRIFQHVGRLFLPGTSENVLCSLNELLVNTRREPIGIGLFAGSNSNGCDKNIETGRIIRNRASWPSFGTSSLQKRPISPDSSRKLINSLLRQQGIFFIVPGRKSLPKC